MAPQGSAAFDALAQVEVRIFPESAADLALNADASEYLIVASSTQVSMANSFCPWAVSGSACWWRSELPTDGQWICPVISWSVASLLCLGLLR